MAYDGPRYRVGRHVPNSTRARLAEGTNVLVRVGQRVNLAPGGPDRAAQVRAIYPAAPLIGKQSMVLIYGERTRKSYLIPATEVRA